MADIPKSRLVYIDETGIDTYLYYEYCRATKGVGLIGMVSGAAKSTVEQGLLRLK